MNAIVNASVEKYLYGLLLHPERKRGTPLRKKNPANGVEPKKEEIP